MIRIRQICRRQRCILPNRIIPVGQICRRQCRLLSEHIVCIGQLRPGNPLLRPKSVVGVRVLLVGKVCHRVNVIAVLLRHRICRIGGNIV